MKEKEETVYTSVQLRNCLTNLLDILPIKPENVLIVGSLALDLAGFTTPMHDLDLEVRNMSPELIQHLKLIQEVGRKGEKHYSHPEANRYDIQFRGVEVNIWNVQEFTCSVPLFRRGFPCSFSDPMSVFKRKKEYGRLKDLKALQGFAIHILEPLKN